MKKMLSLLLVLIMLLVLAGCAQNDKTNGTTTDADVQTTLETVPSDDGQEIMLQLEEQTMAEQTADAGTSAEKSEPTAAQDTTEVQTALSSDAEATADY